MQKPEMPHDRHHLSPHSYFRGFTRNFSSLRSRPISKARSTEKLAEPRFGLHKRAHSTRDVSRGEEELEAWRLQIEEELELRVLTLDRIKKYKEVTVPTSIKFAVSTESLTSVGATMARPRSPSKSSSDTDLLDQTLLSIRKRLTSLSSDRVELETKMEALMTGIKTVHQQCCHQLQQQRKTQPSPQAQAYASIRRVRSSATPSKRPTYLTMPKTVSSSSSQEYLVDSYSLSQDTVSILSASSQGSLNSQPILRQRSESAAASLRSRSKPPALSVPTSNSSGSLQEEPATIQELPESPKTPFSSPFSTSSQSLQQSHRSPGTFRRSISTSSTSPPSTSATLRHSNLVTSTPNISHPYEKRDYYHTLPNFHSSNRNSLPDSVMNTVIPEDQVDNSSTSDSLSQLSSCTDDSSPRNPSAIIVRRSSLTGQIEQYRKPRSLSKKSSGSMDLCAKPPPSEDAGLSRTNSCTGTKETQFRVLSKTRRSTRRNSKSVRASQIILPSIETTV